jgi:hypothetical protein
MLEVGGLSPAFLSVSALLPSVFEHFQKDDLVGEKQLYPRWAFVRLR